MTKIGDKVLESAEFELPIMSVTELVKQLHLAGIPVYGISFFTQVGEISQNIRFDLESYSDDGEDLDPLDELDEDSEQH